MSLSRWRKISGGKIEKSRFTSVESVTGCVPAIVPNINFTKEENCHIHEEEE